MAFRTGPANRVDTAATNGSPAFLAYVSRRPRSAYCAEGGRHSLHRFRRRDGRSIKTRTTTIRIIARTTRIFAES